MSVDGERKRDLRELIDGRCSETKVVENEGVIKEENLVEEGNLKVNGIAENVKDGHGGALQSSASLQVPQQQQSSEAIVCWEKFLHLRSLKVLLVENDDSTRHIVSALLRNCSYEVVETANELQAWKILEDLTNHIDLVLTEVAMPCMSGIGLLCKIMSHKTRNSIPVIMMSSQDSMGLVFTCLSKGAVDFLVKPIRKNELKNLWQHVWRRCHSSSDSGSGSESGTQTQKSVKSKSIEQSDNNTGSKEEEDDGSTGLNIGDGSDHGIGTQSSLTKQAAEAESPRALDQVGCPDSTCAQAIRSNAEIFNDKLVHTISAKERQEQDDQLGEDGNDAEREIIEPRNLDLQFKHLVEDPVKVEGMRQNDLIERGHGRFTEQIDGQLPVNKASPSNNLNYEVVDLAVVTAKSTNSQKDHEEFEAPSMHLKIPDIGSKTTGNPKEISPFECGIKKCRVIQDVGSELQEDRNVLRRSESSAFSRYSVASQARKVPGVNLKIASPQDSSLGVAKNVLVHNKHSDSNGFDPNQCSNIGSNNINRGSAANNSAMKSLLLKSDSSVMSTFECSHLLSASQTMKNEMLRHSRQEKANDTASTILLAQQSNTHHELQIQHHIAPQCGSSNVLNAHIADNAGNYSIIRSVSGSNHGSNGQNGASTAANPGSTNITGDIMPAGQSGSGDASGSESGNGVDESRFAQREAALTKFRLKRKERCFRKKVRYQSRKRLAEQRPQVRGQFVPQVANENTSRSTES